MGMDKETLEAIARQKQYEDRLDELRRESAARTQKSLDNLSADIEEHSKAFDAAQMHFIKVTDERSRQYGMESLSTLIMQMRPSLEAYAKMAGEYRAYLLSKVAYAIASNINFQSSPGWVLEAGAEGCRQMQTYLEDKFGMMDELPPVFVPYLAEVGDNGVLSVNLDVPNTQMTDAARETFVNQYRAGFEASVNGWINNSHTLAGEPMAIVNTPDGPKIEIQPAPVAPVGGGPAVVQPARYMTKDEFCEFRDRVLEPALEQHFTVDFKPETSRNMTP